MPRKDWFYVPLPIEQAKALDEILSKEGKKYGIIDRTEFIRLILGEFIETYERTGKNMMDTRRRLHRERENNHK